MLTDKQKLENVAFFFRFFFGRRRIYEADSLARFTWEVEDWDMVGRRVRTYARTLQSIFNLGLVYRYHTTESNPRHKSVQVQRLERVRGVVTVCGYPTEITL